MQVLGEGQRWQQKVGEAPRAGFGALPLERGSGRAGHQDAQIGPVVHQRLEVLFPVLVRLDLVEKQMAHALAAGRGVLDLADQSLQRLPVQQRVVHFHIGDALRMRSARQQIGDQVPDQDGLAHPARPQQHHGPAQAGLQQQLSHGVQISARAQGQGRAVHRGALPPRVQPLKMFCNLLI